MSELEIKIKKIFTNVLSNYEGIDMLESDTNLWEHGLNSISFINIIVEIENEFGFEFQDEELGGEKFQTINNLSDYIKNCKS